MKVKHFELVELANNFLQNYEMKLGIPIEFNTRLKKVFGRYRWKKVEGRLVPVKIEMSVDFMSSHPKEHIFDVFKHELVHYALSVKGMPFHDGDYIFESELKKYGVNSTRTYNYLGEMHRYECITCGNIYERKRKLVKTAFCQCSRGPNLKYLGTINKQYNEASR